MSSNNQTNYSFPVWGTQGGGLVREVGGKFIFVEAPPESMGLTVGDEMPEQWDRIPANNLAREEDSAYLEDRTERDMAHGRFTGGYRDPARIAKL